MANDMASDIDSKANTTDSIQIENSFRPFTLQSYLMLVERERYLKELDIKRAKHAQEAHLVDGELKFGSQDVEDRLPPENPDLKEGAVFTKVYGPFPEHLLGIPIEELDPGIRDKTFVIINSRFRKKYISRYTATSSLFIFSPWNPLRKAALYIATHQLFDLFIFLTIMSNCFVLAIPTWPKAEKIEYGFLAIYTFECLVKVVGRGFVTQKNTYLRDPWNWLDFTVILAAFLTILLQFIHPQLTVGNLRGLRTFRVLRALKTVSILPGLRTIVNALLRAFKMLFEVILLTIFCLMMFAIFGLQLYMGALRQKCVLNVSGYEPNSSETYDDYYARWVRNPRHWYSYNNDYLVCGNNSGAGLCPKGFTCIPNIGDNPRFGYLNFDHIGWALLSCFQLITLDFWEDIYNKIVSANGPWHVGYFIITIFFGAFYLINLMLAVVSMSYEEEAVSAVKEKEREKKENARKKHNALYDVNYLQIKAKLQAASLAKSLDDEMFSHASDINASAGESVQMKLSNTNSFTPVKFKKVPAMIGSHMSDVPHSDDQSTVTIIKADTLLDPEVGFLDNKVIDRNCDCCEKWVCKYSYILLAQNYVYVFVSDPLFDLFITACIAINTIFMSLEHHNQPSGLTTTLIVANYIFTGVFMVEATFKIFGLGKYYFTVGWNIFDLVTVLAGILDLALEQVNGLNVLRTFRLLRVFKLAQSWPTMRLLLTIILSTLGALGNLCLILVIVIYIFAVIGLQLFRDAYVEQNFSDGLPRWNFTDFYHSMLMIFRVLCGEWIEPLYDCMRATDEICMVVFLPALVFGNFIVLNLFLALLLNAFASDSLDRHRETSAERSKLMDGVNRLKQIVCCCFAPPSENPPYEPDKVSDNDCLGEPSLAELQENCQEIDSVHTSVNKSEKGTDYNSRNISPKNVSRNNSVFISESSEKINEYDPETKESSSSLESVIIGPPPDCFPYFMSSRSKESIANLVTSKTTILSVAKEPLIKSVENVINIDTTDAIPQTYRMPCIDLFSNTAVGRVWTSIRSIGNIIVNHTLFEATVMLMILGSSLALAFEDIYLYQKPMLAYTLMVSNTVFAILFTFEMILRWIGMGFTEYFTNLWTILDFCIVLVSLLSVLGDFIGFGNIAAFKSLRTLRSLRPLRAISRWQGMKIVVNALMNAIPAIMNVFLVCMVFWLIFSIMGVQFFKGKFYKCINNTSHDTFDYTIVPNKAACALANGSWLNPNVNFDNAAIGFLALFQVATFEGWMEVINSAVDSTEVDQQPRYEANPFSYVYFVVFIVFGSFFSMNLFIGVIIDNFNILKKKYEGSYLDAFLTQSQRSYYNTLKKLMKKKPQKSIKRPQNTFQLFFYNMTMSSRFEMGLMLIIFMNMIGLAVSHYREPESVSDVLEMINIIFTFIFTLEALAKIIGLQLYYFRLGWNVFDFIVLVLSILGASKSFLQSFPFGLKVNSVMSSLAVTPSLIRIIHIFRIGNVLRLIKGAKGIRKLLFALVISLPAIFNIGALLFLVMFMYAILGMSSFGTVKLNGVLSETVNFQTFGSSFMLLLRLATSAGWNDVLEALLIKVPNCNPYYYTLPDGKLKPANNGDCGIPYLAIPFMVSYIIIVWLIVINMYIAVILENFNQAHEQEEVGITEDDFDMFYTVWEKYDPYASQFIQFEQLADFVNDLEPPLQIPKPNDITLVSFNIPIMEGEKIHCLDILVALVRNVLSDVQESEELNTLKEQMETKLAQCFPSRVNTTVKSSTLQRKKEDVAARTLQRSWRSFKAQRAMRNITALAVQQKTRRISSMCLRSRSSVMNNLSNRISVALDYYFSVYNDSGSIKYFFSVDPENIEALHQLTVEPSQQPLSERAKNDEENL